MKLSVALFSRYVECHYAGYRDLFIAMLSVIMVSVVLLNVVILSVVGPKQFYLEAKETMSHVAPR